MAYYEVVLDDGSDLWVKAPNAFSVRREYPLAKTVEQLNHRPNAEEVDREIV